MIKIKFLIVTFCCCLLAVGAAVWPFVKKQEEQIADQMLCVAEKMLKYYAVNAAIPLLADDYITLNNIVKGSREDADFAYVAILDPQGNIKAHANPDRIGAGFVLADNVFPLEVSGTDLDRDFSEHIDQADIIDLSRKVVFNEKNVGTIHLGLAAAHWRERLGKLKREALLAIFLYSLALFTVLVIWHFHRLKKYRQCYSQGFKAVAETRETLALSPGEDREKVGAQSTDLRQFTRNSSLTRVLSQPLETPSPYASRKQATILFAGIKNFNEYAGEGNPEDIIHALNEYIRLASDVIGSHGGYVDKIIGDSVIGIFGVSVYRTDHSERAVRAAYQLQQQLLTASLAQKNPLLGMVRIGISSGVVLSGNIGAHSKVEYSSIGESIKEAFWLNDAAGKGEIFISRNVYNLCGEFVEVEDLPPLTLLGQSAVVECCRLTGLRQ